MWPFTTPYPEMRVEQLSEEYDYIIVGLWKNRTHADFCFRGFGEVVEVAKSIGLPYIPDINSPTHPPFGCARLHFTIDEDAYRHSTYHAFLPKHTALACARTGRLHICTSTIVKRLEIERAPSGELLVTGVVLGPTVEGKGPRKAIRAVKEVILSAGPFGSPHILIGIGPAEHLKEHSITVVHDLPAVGSNLQDHFGVSVGFNIALTDSLLQLEKRPWRFLFELLRYLLWGTGLLLVPAHNEPLPDIEIMPSLLSVLLSPSSHGTVRLTSAHPHAPLSIEPHYLSSPADLAPLRVALRLSRRLHDALRGREYALVDATVPADETVAALDAWGCRTAYYYSSTRLRPLVPTPTAREAG
ncbi:GMC oxidoreductase-domain-containing protein [Trametes meyenii]|nr:GMC oxidoreductase-domain-containing protein [Trametes meyenii]